MLEAPRLRILAYRSHDRGVANDAAERYRAGEIEPPPLAVVRTDGAAGGSLEGPRLVSIGPATSAELRAHGAEPDVEADPHTPDGLIEAVLR